MEHGAARKFGEVFVGPLVAGGIWGYTFPAWVLRSVRAPGLPVLPGWRIPLETRNVHWIAASVIIGFCPVVWAQNAATDSESAASRAPELSSVVNRAASQAAENLLNKRVDSIDWREKTFEEVLDWLRDQGEDRVNILPKWNSLNTENVNRDSPVSLRLDNTTVAEVLADVFELLSETGQVTYHGVGNKLTISTKQDFNRKLYTKVYDATDLMFRIPDFGQGIPQIDLQRAGQAAQGGGGGQGVFQGGGGQQQEENQSGQQAEQTIFQRMGVLRNTIQNSVAPESWNRSGQTVTGPAGGGGGGQLVLPAGTAPGPGRIEIFNRSLIITNTIEVHEMIADRFALGS